MCVRVHLSGRSLEECRRFDLDHENTGRLRQERKDGCLVEIRGPSSWKCLEKTFQQLLQTKSIENTHLHYV